MQHKSTHSFCSNDGSRDSRYHLFQFNCCCSHKKIYGLHFNTAARIIHMNFNLTHISTCAFKYEIERGGREENGNLQKNHSIWRNENGDRLQSYAISRNGKNVSHHNKWGKFKPFNESIDFMGCSSHCEAWQLMIVTIVYRSWW